MTKITIIPEYTREDWERDNRDPKEIARAQREEALMNTPEQSGYMTTQQLIRLLQEYSEEHGTVYSGEYQKHAGNMHWRELNLVFGSLENACNIAGVPFDRKKKRKQK